MRQLLEGTSQRQVGSWLSFVSASEAARFEAFADEVSFAAASIDFLSEAAEFVSLINPGGASPASDAELILPGAFKAPAGRPTLVTTAAGAANPRFTLETAASCARFPPFSARATPCTANIGMASNARMTGIRLPIGEN